MLKEFPREGEHSFEYPLSDFSVGADEEGCDLDMLYFKLCSDSRMLPIVSMLTRLRASTSGESERAAIDI